MGNALPNSSRWYSSITSLSRMINPAHCTWIFVSWLSLMISARKRGRGRREGEEEKKKKEKKKVQRPLFHVTKLVISIFSGGRMNETTPPLPPPPPTCDP